MLTFIQFRPQDTTVNKGHKKDSCDIARSLVI